jgi:hypothetical protein
VQHYGSGGTFWAGKENPLPVTVWEIWNEPNRGWNGADGVHPEPQEYGRFLKRSANALRAAQGATPIIVLFGGLLTLKTGSVVEENGSRENLSVRDFLEQASKVTGLSAGVNGVGLHPYAFGGTVLSIVEQVATNISVARENINTFLGSAKGIWITELGWPVEPWGDAKHPGVSPQMQSELLTASFNWITEHQECQGTQCLLWYFYRDVPGQTGWDGHAGLRDESGNYRPSWWAYLAQTKAAAWPPPAVATGEASGVQEKQVTLNGTVNYGSSVPVPDGKGYVLPLRIRPEHELGLPGETAVVGDWNGDGVKTPGVYDPSS